MTDEEDNNTEEQENLDDLSIKQSVTPSDKNLPEEPSLSDSDRRISDKKPSSVSKNRRAGTNRKTRSTIGRERYLDMVTRERALFAQQGSTKTTEQLLSASGAGSDVDVVEGERDSATGDQLRALMPVQSWMPLSIHLVSLDHGLLTIAPLHEVNDRQEKNLIDTARRAGFKVDSVDKELWDRADLLKTLHEVHDLSADRCEKTLSSWLYDVDNGLLLNQFMRDMMAEALNLRASDIHLVQDNAPDAPNWIRYRIDGDIIPVHLLPAEAMARLTTLIKRDAGLNFGDRSTPKDGRFGFTWQGRSIDVRVAAGPQAQDGEKLTLRLLDRAGLKGFEELFSHYGSIEAQMARLLSPEVKGGGGLILMSGPTGSGKSTTLYACVLEIDRRRRHVLTIEDPIEYDMRYTTQWQVAHGVNGREFSDLIRAAMRHDPDYIIIGEMRDAATVETALKAAESGHTVISTIHADTAVQTLERLKSFMPSERERSSTYTLSQQIRAVLNQRLVKTLCHGCKIRTTAGEVLTHEEMEDLELEKDTVVSSHNSRGCDLCNSTGYLGRTLLLESLVINSPASKRDPIFKALMVNVNDIIQADQVEYNSRKHALCELIKDGSMDAKTALMMRE